MSIDENKKIEMPQEESQEAPTNLEFKNEAGIFRIRLTRQGSDYLALFEIENNEGKKVVLNNLLPEEYRVFACWRDEEFGSFHSFTYKRIDIEMNAVEQGGWKYLLSILHEIGHAVISQSSGEEHEKAKEREILGEQSMAFEGKKLKSIVGKSEKMQSENERNAWAYAIRQFKKILKEFKIDPKTIFASNAEIRNYFNERLLSRKEGGKEFVKGKPLSDEDRQELLEEIDKLYTRQN